MSEIKEINLATSECSDRRSQVLSEYGALAPGESLVIVNGFDPVPLLELLNQKFSGEFSYEYLKKDPSEYKIQLNKKSSSCCGFCS